MFLTSAFWKIKNLKRKIKVIQGGQGASKTYSILQILFLKAIEEKLTITIITETYPQLRDGVIVDMKNIMADAGMYWGQYYHGTDHELRLYESIIQFRNLDNKDFQKGKGPRRDYLFINEANRTHYNSVEQMITRTKQGTFIDFNPDREFWVQSEILTREDADFIILTYKDNEMIDEGEKKEIENRRHLKSWWRIYGEGQLGIYSDRQIYTYDFFDTLPADAKRINSGMDFGVSPDPTTLIDVWKKDSKLFINEVFCMTNLLPEKLEGAVRQSIVDKLDEVKHIKGHLIIADSAGATEIRDIRQHGYYIRGVKKGTGSVISGINKLRGYELFITRTSTNLKRGIEGWHFKVDANGKIIPEPDGHEPDGLAALRYVIMEDGRGGFGIV